MKNFVIGAAILAAVSAATIRQMLPLIGKRSPAPISFPSRRFPATSQVPVAEALVSDPQPIEKAQLEVLRAESHPRNEAQIGIVKQSQNIDLGGSYEWGYETENKIVAEEQGQLKNAGNPEQEAEEARGVFEWDSPEGQHFKVVYLADENGFQPQAEHIPTPPPIPPLILKALKYNEAHPEEEQDEN